ncbi:hypothetical protein BH708_14545 [Brachybacterium sp. P6-10-X1]|uniref:DUF2087 domain-containing protein n=1 Tax=Brachybacterium sp. P6-10-X1 TaxID=1903186 RepID=UPI0009718871|nr:DUF2087 domain-containing protein [Brachybacterium sp. P6-10-X1]APX33728.1 hypothetical protein BH708_14545 [Brachybacterium sp. P6-10-X1]
MPTPRDLPSALSRARMLCALLATPKLRQGLGTMLSGAGASEDSAVRGPLSRLDWIDEDGEVDAAALRETAEMLALLRSGEAILEVPQLPEIPQKIEESREVCGRIAELVFDRVGRERTLGEAELNAAIAMFAQDVALVRRDAVDAGVLTRSADGTAYRLAEAA